MKSQLILMAYNFAILSVLFVIGWYYCFSRKLFAWIDFFWSSSFIVIIFINQVYNYKTSGQINFRIIELLYVIWSLRLSSHLYYRIKRSGEDKRYIELIKKWKIWYGLNFFILFQIESLLAVILSIPLFLTYTDHSPLTTYISVFIFILAISGETLADKQLSDFIKDKDKKSKVCNKGLWRYSRHPNYFFEWLIWVSYAVYSLNSSYWWPGIIPSLIMFHMLTKVTGIPYAEQSSLLSKKEEYMKYQKQTNAFFPWIPKLAILLCLSFGPLNLFANGDIMNHEDKIKSAFNNLRADNIEILNEFYDEKSIFIDPLGTHNGRESIKAYYKNLYKNVTYIKFNFNNIIANGNSYSLYWTMTLSAQGLNSGKPIIVEGNSHITFNNSGLVIYHRDYFDMGEFIYEHLPVMGWTIDKIKKRLKSIE